MKTSIISVIILFSMIQYGFSNKIMSINSSNNIGIINFTLKSVSDYVEISWTSNAHNDNYVFVLERSDNAVFFTTIDTIFTQTESNQYVYNDKNPVTGLLYYKLRYINLSGEDITSEMSSIDVNYSVQNESYEILQPYPIPFANNLNLEVKCKDEMNLTIKISDLDGKTLVDISKICSKGYNNFVFSEIVNLKNGSYYLAISDEYMNTKTIHIIKYDIH